jgi:hypothetical protein
VVGAEVVAAAGRRGAGGAAAAAAAVASGCNGTSVAAASSAEESVSVKRPSCCGSKVETTTMYGSPRGRSGSCTVRLTLPAALYLVLVIICDFDSVTLRSVPLSACINQNPMAW